MGNIIRFDEFSAPAGGCSVALGFFDGVHLGHQLIIERAMASATAQGLLPVVYTFVEHPISILCPSHSPDLLTDTADRLRMLADRGVTCLYDTFTSELAKLEAREFFATILVERLRARCLTCGLNYRFGSGARGNGELLSRWGEQAGIRVGVAPLVRVHNDRVLSSSLLRHLVREGDFESVNEGLGRPFAVANTVVRGCQLGRKWGFPTANLEWPAQRVKPAFGAYACQVVLPNNAVLPAVGYFGTRPTVSGTDGRATLEINIGHWDENRAVWNDNAFELDDDGEFKLYGQKITVRFYRYLAAQECFGDVQALKQRLLYYREQAALFFQSIQGNL